MNSTADPKAPFRALGLLLSLCALWTLTHHYQGLAKDGEIYAVQAMSRLHPYLATDVYLANTSQDSFTIFSPLFATLIRWLGLIGASTTLFALCTALHLGAAWSWMRRLFDARRAYLTVALLIATTLPYGAYRIFHVSEDYLTARSLAEGLVVLSVALQARNRFAAAVVVAIAALFVHPLMAFPGALLIGCLAVRERTALLLFAAGLLASVALCALSASGHAPAGFLQPMDPSWLEVVIERSQFLFLRYWTRSDFEVQLTPFLSLVLTYCVISDARVRKLCFAAALVGLSGLAVAAVAGAIGPIPLLLQGQAWRWTWIASLVACCLVVPCALELWGKGGMQRLCALLFLCGWIFEPVDSNLAIAGALILWLGRERLPVSGWLLRVAVAVFIGIALAWSLANVLQLLHANSLEEHATFGPIAVAIEIFGMHMVALGFALGCWLLFQRNRPAAAFFALLLGGLFAWMLPNSLLKVTGFDLVRTRDEYRDWREAIPETSSVLQLPSSKTAGFVWITLERTSYSTVSQSAGVVFSPKTASEIRRRSEILRPVMQPDWRILSQIRKAEAGKGSDEVNPPLTAQSLTEICRDPQLGFVMAKEDVGFSPIRHTHYGAHKDWNLYDCRKVRIAGSST